LANDNPIHLIGLTEAEANACLDEHGVIETCTWDNCSGSTVVQLMFKKPDAGFAQEVKSLAACVEHKPALEKMIADNATQGVKP